VVSYREPGLTPSALIFLYGRRALEQGNPEPLNVLSREKLELKFSDLSSNHSSYESEARNLAQMLLMYSELEPKSQITADLAREFSKMGIDGKWRNTQENTFALLALSSFLKNRKILFQLQGRLELYQAGFLGRWG
jgi:hypothetical protein